MSFQVIAILILLGCIGTVVVNLVLMQRKRKRQEAKEDRKHQDNMKWAEAHRRTP